MIDEAEKSMEKKTTFFLKSKSTPQGIFKNFGKLGSMWSQVCALHVQISAYGRYQLGSSRLPAMILISSGEAAHLPIRNSTIVYT